MGTTRRARTRLVAFDVMSDSDADADQIIIDALVKSGTIDPNAADNPFESWHIAEDDALDAGHDSQPAVFCASGKQAKARKALRQARLA